MYKLLAIDIDGTLMTFKQPQITQRVKEAIQRAKEKGTHVILISGRNYRSMNRMLQDLDIKDYGITINGGIIVDIASGENISATYLDRSVASGITSIFESEGIPYAIFAGFYTYAPREHEYNNTVEYLKLEEDNVRIYDDTEEFLNTVKTNKYMGMASHEKLDKIAKLIKEQYDDYVFIEYGLREHMEIYPKTINKGIALTSLADKLSIPMEEVMAIGDAENDISMLEAAGLGVAMGNALSSVKEKADYITKSVEDDGVAYAIEKFIINK
ncbi:Cof-type HAD-IIB family hydrolase [Alkalibaculum sp. M08DMB]|uniref:Cof-type HAD-IIB family hydrolase n=1 Tax=Alkalibaculum sporogenes TaxID=2655001 RepID=A0A6A7KD00_9FIRM|nr:Cof-type HAD-IIB family hydrolase [Alkalibaculum sporogenes]MPW26873.1 Cof-type HAD-IIB family hydrolase [Alkalibaculum sporogenes]